MKVDRHYAIDGIQVCFLIETEGVGIYKAGKNLFITLNDKVLFKVIPITQDECTTYDIEEI